MTRFVTATVMDTKQPATIICGFFLSWIVIFGSPLKVQSDNGRDFFLILTTEHKCS